MAGHSKIIKAIDNPGTALLHLYNKLHSSISDIRFDTNQYEQGRLSNLFSYTNISQKDCDRYIDEIENNECIIESNKTLGKIESGTKPPARSVALYILTRYFKPDVCIETGVRHGESTIYILEALKKNENGKLYSIDVPSPELPDNASPGWIIPEKSRDRWSLTIGKSQDELEPLLEDLGNVDLFYHDSYHKYPLMDWEFNTALEYMGDGIVSSHDINRNHAFLELCSKTSSTVNIVEPYRIGGKGLFGFAFVGDEIQDQGIKMAEDR